MSNNYSPRPYTTTINTKKKGSLSPPKIKDTYKSVFIDQSETQFQKKQLREKIQQQQQQLPTSQLYKMLPNINNSQSKGQQLQHLQENQGKFLVATAGNSIMVNKSNHPNPQQRSEKTEDILNQVARLSNVLYILGPLANQLLYFVENSEKLELQVRERIEKMQALDFVVLQSEKREKLLTVFQKFIIDNVMSGQMQGQKDRDGLREIGEIIKREFSRIMEHYELYINNQEMNLQKRGIFQDKEVILLTDFYEGLRTLVETYNYQYVEMGSFGKTRPEHAVLVKSLYHFKCLLKSDEKNKLTYELFDDIEGVLRSQFEKISNQLERLEKLSADNAELTRLYEKLQKEKRDWEIFRLQLLKNSDGKANQDGSSESFIDLGNGNTNGNNGSNDALKKYGITKRADQNSQASTVHIKALEEFYQQQAQNLKMEIQKLTDQVSKLTRNLQMLQGQIAVKDKEIQSLQFQIGQNTTVNTLTNNKTQATASDNSTVQTPLTNSGGAQNVKKKPFKISNREDKEVQCMFVNESNPITKRDFAFSSIVLSPSAFLKSANVQSLEWTMSIINVVLNERIISEIFDEADRRPRPDFKTFLCQWFLRRFGCKEIAELVLKDFLISLKKFGRLHERFKLFSDLADFEDLIDPESDQNALNSIGISRHKFRRAYMRTNEALRAFSRVTHTFRSTGGATLLGQSSYIPLLPNMTLRGMDLINLETAQKMYDALMPPQPSNQQQEDDNGERNIEIVSVEGSFRKIMSMDLQMRSRDPLEIYNAEIQEDGEDQYVRFDVLVRQLLDLVLEQRFFELESTYSALKLKSASKYECMIQYEDFVKMVGKAFPRKSERWLELAYTAFSDGVLTDKTPLSAALLRLVPLIVDDDQLKENFLNIKAAIIKAGGAQQSNTADGTNAKPDHLQGKSKVTNKTITNSPSNFKNIPISSIQKQPQNVINRKANTRAQEEAVQEREKLNLLYDHINELGLLEESYRIFQPLITNVEKKNEVLMRLHESYKEEFMLAPSVVYKMNQYDPFQEHDKADLREIIDSCWNKFRKMLYVLSRPSL